MGAPAGYLITFAAYGARLHGDPRGTSLRNWQATPGTPTVAPNPRRVAAARRLMKNAPPYFGPKHRRVIRETVEQVCAHKGWCLHGLNVRTNHVHTVVSTPTTPEFAMQAFKAWATRRLREAGLAGPNEELWARHGSTKHLKYEQDVIDALEYVLERRGEDLPEA